VRGTIRGFFVAVTAVFPVLVAGMIVPAQAAITEHNSGAAASAKISKSHPRPWVETIVALPYGARDWQYKQVPWGADPHFYFPIINPHGWHDGRAAFGTTNGSCSWNNSTYVHTQWALNTDMLTRHWLRIPAHAFNVRISGTIDNDATVYFNGDELQSVTSGNCQSGAIDVTVPRRDLNRGYDLLAIRGHDYGVADFLDVTVTYEIAR